VGRVILGHTGRVWTGRGQGIAVGVGGRQRGVESSAISLRGRLRTPMVHPQERASFHLHGDRRRWVVVLRLSSPPDSRFVRVLRQESLQTNQSTPYFPSHLLLMPVNRIHCEIQRGIFPLLCSTLLTTVRPQFPRNFRDIKIAVWENIRAQNLQPKFFFTALTLEPLTWLFRHMTLFIVVSPKKILDLRPQNF